MDNGYFIGYRVDVDSEDFSHADSPEGFEKRFNVDMLPGKEWMIWSKAGGGNAILWMDGPGADYRCPIDREELWKDLHSRTFDFPDDGIAVYQRLWNHPMYRYLIKKYDAKRVNVRWGVFMTLG
jgi:hypothetical protein